MSTEWEIWTDASVSDGQVAIGGWVIHRNGRLFEAHTIDLFYCGRPECIGNIVLSELFTLKCALRRMRSLIPAGSEQDHALTARTDCQPVFHVVVNPDRSEGVARTWGLSARDMLKRYGGRLEWVAREKNRAADRVVGRIRDRRGRHAGRVLTLAEDGQVGSRESPEALGLSRSVTDAAGRTRRTYQRRELSRDS